MVNRRRKQRTQASLLDASWILGSDGAELYESGTSQPPTSNGSILSQKEIHEQNATNVEQDTPDSPEIQRLRAPDGLQSHSTGSRSPALSQSSGRLGPPSTEDDASEKSQQVSHEQKPSVAKARKKRYASEHHSHWLEETDAMQSQQSLNEADNQNAQTQHKPQADSLAKRLPGNRSPKAPPSSSPSIFRLPASPHGGEQGYDAPPISPQVQPNYSPLGYVSLPRSEGIDGRTMRI